MQELIDRIEQLERAVRRWRTTALVLGALLLSLGTTGATLFTIGRAQALRAEDEARRQAILARDLAEAARLEALPPEKK